MPDIISVGGVKIAPAFNVTIPRTKKGSQKAIAEMYYDMYAIADSLAVEDITIKSRQMFTEHIEDKIKGENIPRELSFVELYKFRTDRTAFHLNNMIAMFNKACEQPSKDTTEK